MQTATESFPSLMLKISQQGARSFLLAGILRAGVTFSLDDEDVEGEGVTEVITTTFVSESEQIIALLNLV